MAVSDCYHVLPIHAGGCKDSIVAFYCSFEWSQSPSGTVEDAMKPVIKIHLHIVTKMMFVYRHYLTPKSISKGALSLRVEQHCTQSKHGEERPLPDLYPELITWCGPEVDVSPWRVELVAVFLYHTSFPVIRPHF